MQSNTSFIEACPWAGDANIFLGGCPNQAVQLNTTVYKFRDAAAAPPDAPTANARVSRCHSKPVLGCSRQLRGSATSTSAAYMPSQTFAPRCPATRCNRAGTLSAQTSCWTRLGPLQLAMLCEDTPGCVGFTTRGALKSSLKPQLDPWPNPGPCDGVFTKQSAAAIPNCPPGAKTCSYCRADGRRHTCVSSAWAQLGAACKVRAHQPTAQDDGRSSTLAGPLACWLPSAHAPVPGWRSGAAELLRLAAARPLPLCWLCMPWPVWRPLWLEWHYARGSDSVVGRPLGLDAHGAIFLHKCA